MKEKTKKIDGMEVVNPMAKPTREFAENFLGLILTSEVGIKLYRAMDALDKAVNDDGGGNDPIIDASVDLVEELKYWYARGLATRVKMGKKNDRMGKAGGNKSRAGRVKAPVRDGKKAKHKARAKN